MDGWMYVEVAVEAEVEGRKGEGREGEEERGGGGRTTLRGS